MENNKLLNSDIDLSEHEPKTFSSVIDYGILPEDVKQSYENDIDDLILVPEKVIITEKQPSLENTFEVIDQESKTFHDVEEDTKITQISNDEVKINLLESDSKSFTKIEELATSPKTESPKEEESLILKKLETKINDLTKTATNQENELVNVLQSDVDIVDPPEVKSKISSKKDNDEGDACDIKIGPEELFCRIGLGKVLKLISNI